MVSCLPIVLGLGLPILSSAAPIVLSSDFFAIFGLAITPLKDWPTDWWEFGHASPSPSSTSTPTSTATPFGSASVTLKPTAGTSWNIQLNTVPTADQANDQSYQVWDFDMEGSTPDLIKAFHDKGHQVICYFSAGSWENYRSDKDDFPKAAFGKTMDGWPDEKWVDIRNDGVRAVMGKRIQAAKDKGCDGVDPDNIDVYENDSGFDITQADGIDYVKFLSNTAHSLGLAYGLKNGGAIVNEVIDYAEWDINEECVDYEECALYRPFIENNKPVFHIEYPDDKPKLSHTQFVTFACGDADAKGFSTLMKDRSLNGQTWTCPT